MSRLLTLALAASIGIFAVGCGGDNGKTDEKTGEKTEPAAGVKVNKGEETDPNELFQDDEDPGKTDESADTNDDPAKQPPKTEANTDPPKDPFAQDPEDPLNIDNPFDVGPEPPKTDDKEENKDASPAPPELNSPK